MSRTEGLAGGAGVTQLESVGKRRYRCLAGDSEADRRGRMQRW